ncbi:MAG: dependent oxidoreductase [Brevundimonas sp.]|nr:dependent oxidoreductase [Brevundimonas sp.]
MGKVIFLKKPSISSGARCAWPIQSIIGRGTWRARRWKNSASAISPNGPRLIRSNGRRPIWSTRANHAARRTVPWRYAILQMHEVLAPIVPHLDSVQFERFNRHFKPVFVDDYGAVPHESIERMLALHDAGKLEILALGDDYRIDTHRPEGGVMLRRGGELTNFPVFIEATGQKPLAAVQFPFLSLLEQGIVRDEVSEDAPGAVRGIVIDDRFYPVAEGLPSDQLFCLSLPFIMGRHPFVQGITSSHEMGEIVGEALADLVDARRFQLEAQAA